MSVRRLGASVLVGGGLFLALLSTPASATVTGGCSGSGTIGADTYDAASLDPDSPITIPEEADVAYTGSVPLPPSDKERAYSGKIELRLPLGGSVTVADWSGSSKDIGDAGTHHYSVPSVVPRGVTIRADGTHNHDGLAAPCKGAFSVKLDGGPLDSPIPTAAALGGTLAAGAALASAAFPKGAKP